jgi:predicted NBD/HSP70 family sugar kinase
VVALLGIGVGAAVFTDGRLYRGSQSSAGEWGHAPIVVGGDACRCGSQGCLEAYVGELTLLRHWAALDPAASAAAGPGSNSLDALFAAAAGEGVAARQVVEGMAEHLGAGLATLINLFNPQRIVLAGSVGLRLTPSILETIRGRAGRYALRQPFESVEIVQGQLGHDAVALGAATLVVDGLLAHGFTLPAPAGQPSLLSGRSR